MPPVTCHLRYEVDPSKLEDFERYREGFGTDPDFVAADLIRERSGCVRRYERTFLRPVLG
jgi:hypothetical protein